MLSKGKVKYIHSLEMKKYRNELNAFVAEGNKLVADMMFAFECELILAKPSWMAMQGNIPAKELLEAECFVCNASIRGFHLINYRIFFDSH